MKKAYNVLCVMLLRLGFSKANQSKSGGKIALSETDFAKIPSLPNELFDYKFKSLLDNQIVTTTDYQSVKEYVPG